MTTKQDRNEIRSSPEEASEWKRQATEAGFKSFSEWARAKLNATVAAQPTRCVRCDEGASAALLAARQVYTQPPNDGETQIVKLYRNLQKEDPYKFLQELGRLEKDHSLVKAARDEGVDAGAEACLKLAEAAIGGMRQRD